jgi:cytochrome c5
MKKLLRVSLMMLLVALLSVSMVFVTGCSADEEPATQEPAQEPTEEPAAEEPAEEPAVAEGEEVLEGACTSCHDVTRIYLQTEMTDWNNVVATMETAHGAVLTDEEKATITEFLESRNPSEAEVVIQGKCTTCHDVSRIYSQPAGANWESILDTMMTVHGAELTEAEQKAVLDYLEAHGQ